MHGEESRGIQCTNELVVELSAHGNLQVQYTTPIVWVWCFDLEFAKFIQRNVLEEQFVKI